MKVTLHLDGRTAAKGSALLMHNERLADPLDTFTRALGEVTSKRKKSIADHEEIGHIEFLGGLYTDPQLEYPLNGSSKKSVPCIPAWNIIRCLQDGAKRQKRGADVLRGIVPLAEQARLEYDGPRAPEQLWQDGGFALRKSVGIQRNKTMRTRPLFTEWEAELPIEVDATVFDLNVLEKAWRDSGVYAGLGDMRPVYGRFTGTVKEAS